ncbi:homeobox protein knotted-1-like 1 [Mangifera indica]|uniref:homeobox protein knotted-1-like 1 n=1 Tax=Mangifera indica TaxID=29780 RepID=UPI001CFB5DF5|nr:homeobox protein knotted-1-like 1 [Mangifera indica]
MEDNDKSSRISSSREKKEEEEENQNNETLKRRISSHPLYGLLIENHMDCLKLGSVLSVESDQDLELHYKQDDENKANNSIHNLSELDHFMEAYCFALSKLKEAMEEPQQETLAFLDAMHSQLTEVTGTTDHPPPDTSSGERD